MPYELYLPTTSWKSAERARNIFARRGLRARIRRGERLAQIVGELYNSRIRPLSGADTVLSRH